jgi:hypothetical protein
MDATTTLAEKGLIPPARVKGTPRPASSYRAFRRNHVKAARGLKYWGMVTAGHANQVSGIAARQAVANGAREATATLR